MQLEVDPPVAPENEPLDCTPANQDIPVSHKRKALPMRPGIDAVTDENVKPIVAKRMIEARQLSGLDQQDAGNLLGYQNGSFLSKIENGYTVAKLSFLQRASLVYGVSLDFLAGLSDYPERDPTTCEQLAIMRSLRDQLWDATGRLLSQLQASASDAVALLGHIGKLRTSAGDSWKALCEAERDFAVGLDTAPKVNGLSVDDQREIKAEVSREFAAALAPFKRAMEAHLDHAELAHRYLKRRGATRPESYLDQVEQTSPLQSINQGGLLGLLEAINSKPLESAQ